MLTDSEYEQLTREAMGLLDALVPDATLIELRSSMEEPTRVDDEESGGIVAVRELPVKPRELFERVVLFLAGRLQGIPSALQVVSKETDKAPSDIVWEPEQGDAEGFPASTVLVPEAELRAMDEHLSALRAALK